MEAAHAMLSVASFGVPKSECVDKGTYGDGITVDCAAIAKDRCLSEPLVAALCMKMCGGCETDAGWPSPASDSGAFSLDRLKDGILSRSGFNMASRGLATVSDESTFKFPLVVAQCVDRPCVGYSPWEGCYCWSDCACNLDGEAFPSAQMYADQFCSGFSRMNRLRMTEDGCGVFSSEYCDRMKRGLCVYEVENLCRDGHKDCFHCAWSLGYELVNRVCTLLSPTNPVLPPSRPSPRPSTDHRLAAISGSAAN
jgi:hypothetical protein